MRATTGTGSTTGLRIAPTKIILPDLVSHCSFDIKINRHRKQATAASKKWLFYGDTSLTLKKRRSFHGLKAGLLTSMCYPDAGYPQLRVCCDFMNCERINVAKRLHASNDVLVLQTYLTWTTYRMKWT
jgi:hypothetical protein